MLYFYCMSSKWQMKMKIHFLLLLIFMCHFIFLELQKKLEPKLIFTASFVFLACENQCMCKCVVVFVIACLSVSAVYFDSPETCVTFHHIKYCHTFVTCWLTDWLLKLLHTSKWLFVAAATAANFGFDFALFDDSNKSINKGILC